MIFIRSFFLLLYIVIHDLGHHVTSCESLRLPVATKAKSASQRLMSRASKPGQTQVIQPRWQCCQYDVLIRKKVQHTKIKLSPDASAADLDEVATEACWVSLGQGLKTLSLFSWWRWDRRRRGHTTPFWKPWLCTQQCPRGAVDSSSKDGHLCLAPSGSVPPRGLHIRGGGALLRLSQATDTCADELLDFDWIYGCPGRLRPSSRS